MGRHETQIATKMTTPESAASPAPETRRQAPVYPFAAIVGQEEMKRALMIAAVEPRIGGVLIFGDRGTGKSTAVRALADLLPDIDVVADCPFNSEPGAASPSTRPDPAANTPMRGVPATIRTVPTPVVELPLGVTEDRVLGALDLERALMGGEKVFAPGLLAKAHRGFLYIDEINLLEDHIVDLLLDVAASGVNIVEREGMSMRHDARFVLVGSGNPEEGDLRPQLLDRFGLSVEVVTPDSPEQRIEVIKRRRAFENDPAAFQDQWTEETAHLRSRVLRARTLLPAVTVSDDVLLKAVSLCIALGSDGLRGELTLVRTATVIAALDGADTVDDDHVRRAAPSALRHRLRRDPLDESGSTARVERAVESVYGD